MNSGDLINNDKTIWNRYVVYFFIFLFIIMQGRREAKEER
jgi:hypothetical protein